MCQQGTNLKQEQITRATKHSLYKTAYIFTRHMFNLDLARVFLLLLKVSYSTNNGSH